MRRWADAPFHERRSRCRIGRREEKAMANTGNQDGRTERAQQYLKAGNVQPSLLLMEAELTRAEKRWILEQRVVDLEAELRASEESMTSPKPGVASESLREAHRALLLLDATEADSAAKS
jgi:hypothetical protein